MLQNAFHREELLMKYLVKFLAVVVLFASVAGCAQQHKALRVSGEDDSISSFLLPVKETFEEENGGVVLDIVRSRSGGQLAQLMRGEVDAIVTVHSLDYLLRAAAAEQRPVDPSQLQSVEVGRNNTVVLLNRKNVLTKLTRAQLKGIFSGKTINWKQLHGNNRAIVVVLNIAPTADNDTFIRDILGKETFAAKLYQVYSYEEVRKMVAETPEAIGVVPSVYASANVNVPTSPEISSPAIVITRGAPSRQVNSLTEILKDMALLQ